VSLNFSSAGFQRQAEQLFFLIEDAQEIFE
jgi:hypothetical protein